jgi:hypothetical protein
MKSLAKKSIKLNLFIYSIFFVFAILGIIYGNSIKSDDTLLRIWGYENILLLLLGVPFLFLQTNAKLPNFVEDHISNKQRFINPVLIGIVFGILDVIVIKLILHPEPYTELPPFLQPFPYSLFLYFSGAFEIEVFYRLIPLTIILLVGSLVSKGKYFKIFFWLGVLLTSLREPLEQLPTGATWFIFYASLSGFLMNSLQAIWYKKAGFLASISLRLGHYLFWHILLGIYVQYFEL